MLLNYLYAKQERMSHTTRSTSLSLQHLFAYTASIVAAALHRMHVNISSPHNSYGPVLMLEKPSPYTPTNLTPTSPKLLIFNYSLLPISLPLPHLYVSPQRGFCACLFYHFTTYHHL